MTTNLLFFILIGMMLYDPKVERGENSHCLFMAAEADKRIWIEMSDITKVHLSNKTVPPRINGSKQLIPYYIHQTNEFDTLPSDMVMAIDSVIEHNPEYEYRFYNGTQRREFIAKNMGKTILQCYDRLVPNAFKADLFRYSVVYTLGGCYMDVGFVFVDHLRNTIRPDDTFLSTQDGFPPLTEANPAFFCATKNNPIIKEALRVVVKKVANSKYGIDPLDITGPRTFGRAFKYYFKNVSMLISPREYGQGIRLIQQNLDTKCKVYNVIDLPRNETLTHHKYPRYSEDMTIFNGQPHYNGFYGNRTVYNESIKIQSDGDYDLEPDPLVK